MSTVSRHDAEPLEALRALRDEERDLADTKRRLIAEARSRGRSWSEIGDALGVSKQAAWQSYRSGVTAMLDRIADRSGLSEDEATRLSSAELAAVRRSRRSRGAR
jgi:hypothetical protein